ncbi:MAG: NUDIX domain-containing protein [Cryomorphaceae bacterium]|nr:NUDIX domain-containing protein [Cryomorphaceae bacterium]
MTEFHLLIAEWYRQTKRDLPWRNTKNPYFIWLSEVILQQTRVDQGISYYYRFVESFPTIQDLANADLQTVLNHWQGLGYYSRARNLHQTAQIIANELNGIFPASYDELLQLKGIGPYTAAAIASFSYKELHCTPKNPKCASCVLQVNCLAFSNKTVHNRPVKTKKTKVKNRFFHYLIFTIDNQTYIQQRKGRDIWEELYQFPLIETDEDGQSEAIMQEYGEAVQNVSTPLSHLLSHQRITARFYHINSLERSTSSDWILIQKSAIDQFPIPRLIDKYLEQYSW